MSFMLPLTTPNYDSGSHVPIHIPIHPFKGWVGVNAIALNPNPHQGLRVKGLLS